MEREQAHDFYLLKAKKKLDVKKSTFYLDVLNKEETDRYVRLKDCWFHDDFMDFIYPSFSGLSVKMDYYGVTLIRNKEDSERLVRICNGWLMIIQEMSESVCISNWGTEFKRKDLLLWMNALKDMAEQMNKHDDYVICYFGI